MKEYTTRVRDAVRAYTEFGLVVVPVEHKGKRPLANTWQQSKVSDHVGAFDSDEAMNVGVLLGSRSGGTVDIDLDTPRARSLADEYLPPTPAVFGRASAPRSHRIYRVTGEPGRGKRYADDTGATAVEWRADGGQTVFPPSVHTSGESIQWASGGDRMPEPARVAEADLRRAVESLAKACGWVESRPESVPVRIDPAASGADTPLDERERRAIAYLDAMPEAVAGQRGHDAAYAAAVAMVHGFCLDQDAALTLLLAHYNPRCDPPWSESELRHKVSDADGKPHDRERGWLLNAREAARPSGRRTGSPILIRMSEVADRELQWLWPGLIPAGKLSMIASDPGRGKSTITIDLAARISRGAPMPGEANPCAAADVILLGAEDGLSDTIGPRLTAARADRSRVHCLTGTRGESGDRDLDLAADSESLRQAIELTGARLVVIDPITAYVGRTDSHKDAEVRGMLRPLASIAEDTGAAFLLVAHLNKAQQQQAAYRVGGSIAWSAAARSVLMVVPDREDKDRRLLVPSKANLGPDGRGFAYRIEEARIDGFARPMTRIAWEPEPLAMSADDALGVMGGPDGGRSARHAASDWLLTHLADCEPHAVAELMDEAEGDGLSWSTIKRAKQDLPITKSKDGRGGWFWQLPGIVGAKGTRAAA